MNYKSDSMVDLQQLQKDMEEVWKMLKMPLELKIDMAIKYSSVQLGVRAEIVNTFLVGFDRG